MRQASLQNAGLLEALTEVALEVQKAGSLDEVLAVSGAALEAMGFASVLLRVEGADFTVRQATAGPLWGLAEVGLAPSDWKDRHVTGNAAAVAAVRHDDVVFVTGLPARLRHLTALGPLAEVLAERVATAGLDAGALVPLRVRSESWGLLFLSHRNLTPADVSTLHLFGLQLGAAIEVAETIERLDRLSLEMSLAHQLAVAGPNADSKALCLRALTTVCLATRSDAGALHRYDAQADTYRMVGEPWGHEGPLPERFRTFTAQQGAMQVVTSMPAGQLPNGGREVLAAGFRHVSLVSLAIEAHPVGLLTLARRDDVPYTEHELHSAEVLGVQMASLLERTGLYEESRRLYADLKKSYDELARTQAELVRHERLAAIGELAAVMAHEVRNPLGVIFNSLSTLKRVLRPQGDAEMLLNIVGEEADRLNRIVSDLLDFVRPYELAKSLVAMAPIIASAVDVASQSVTHGARVVTEFEAELPPFPADGQMLRQALVNIIINALQAMPRGGVVSVRARVERLPGGPPWLVIDVSDEGVGLPPRAAERMFQPFFTTKATGTGLGLAVVKRIIDAHQGEVTARPNGERGTTFTVRLPGPDPRERLLTPPRPSSPVSRRG